MHLPQLFKPGAASLDLHGYSPSLQEPWAVFLREVYSFVEQVGGKNQLTLFTWTHHTNFVFIHLLEAQD